MRSPASSSAPRVGVWAPPGELREALAEVLTQSPRVRSCAAVYGPPEAAQGLGTLFDTLVYVPPIHGGQADPDLESADAMLGSLARAGLRHWVMISSAAVHEPSWYHQGRVREAPLAYPKQGNRVARQWRGFEELVAIHVPSTTRTTILRPTALPTVDGEDFWSRLFRRRWATTAPGFDPPLQLLAPRDLAQAVRRVVEDAVTGVFHVAPAHAVTVHHAFDLAGIRRLPSPWRPRSQRDELEYLRHSWTVSDDELRRSLGVKPEWTSAQRAAELSAGKTPLRPARWRTQPRRSDEFGLDRDYVLRRDRTLRRFLHDRYWRVEWRGLENVPQQGRAILAGVHRGHQPWDGVMAVHLIARELGRVPRFLIHPTLIKWPLLSPFMMRLGGIPACRRNADRVLRQDRLLAIYPEGIRGAFARYRNAYKLRKFGRDEFVRMALRNGAPIVPFVTLGSAEIFPILAKIHWRRWQRWSEWPCLPITPTMGLVPLPSKWHTLFLEPLHVEELYPREAADDSSVVRSISLEVRQRMEAAIDDLLSRRKRIFWGSIFEPGESTAGLEEKLA